MDNGYTEGYATFWNGNAMTELTNGKLDVWTLQSLDEDYVPNWLQRKDHLTTDPQHPFRSGWGREPCGDPKYFGSWQGSLPPALRGHLPRRGRQED